MSAVADSAELSPLARQATVRRLAERQYDVLVIGGGVVGAGTALDAASRGLTVALVEMRDWASGTSSRSGKLIHGGLRYLEQFDFRLVREALRERALLYRTLCPHLVRPIQFLYPLRHRIWERLYVGAGLVVYDVLGGARALPRHRHLSRRGARVIAPAAGRRGLAGALTFYDTQVDDARHTVELVRTAAAHGADVAAAVRVVALTREGGRITGAVVTDSESGRDLPIRARHVINATGVWSAGVDALSGVESIFRVQAAKGVHLLIPRDRIDSTVSMFVRAEDSVLFVRTWGRHWLVGTTDTPWRGSLDDPQPTAADVAYLLRNLNAALTTELTAADVEGVFAGLRPLVVRRDVARTSKLSREHLVTTPAPGLTTVVGGKYTTYRVMARDAVDAAARELGLPVECRTAELPLLGVRGYSEAREVFRSTTLGGCLDDKQRYRLLGRYGGLVLELDRLVRDDTALAAPIPGGGPYLAVEAVYAVTHEGALHLEDVLERRTHIAIETPDRGRAAAPAVAALIAADLGWDPRQRDDEVDRYLGAVETTGLAMTAPDDATAMMLTGGTTLDPRLRSAAKEVTDE